MNEYEKDPGWKYLRLSKEEMDKEHNQPYDSKKNVWVPDPEEGYVAAEVKSRKGDNVTVMVGDKEKTFKKDILQEMNPPKFEKTEDMSNLTFLNDASVLHNLRSRYASMLIYVSIFLSICFHYHIALAALSTTRSELQIFSEALFVEKHGRSTRLRHCSEKSLADERLTNSAPFLVSPERARTLAPPPHIAAADPRIPGALELK
ncbi:unnamed protein product [Cylicostephanus goldi]|uniref:Myosin N-terminal SH3-like domain-containing protein n=1 Tax=Cylicostephanus goldi TaxID=71465 RepID=A0A3P6SJ18_CYLGO|nr:unnamed protein product [Cylicostephanus goldi]